MSRRLQESFQRSHHHPVLPPATTWDSSSCLLQVGCPISPVGARLLCHRCSWGFPSGKQWEQPLYWRLGTLHHSSPSCEPFQGDPGLKGDQIILIQAEILVSHYKKPVLIQGVVVRVCGVFYLYKKKSYRHERKNSTLTYLASNTALHYLIQCICSNIVNAIEI